MNDMDDAYDLTRELRYDLEERIDKLEQRVRQLEELHSTDALYEKLEQRRGAARRA